MHIALSGLKIIFQTPHGMSVQLDFKVENQLTQLVKDRVEKAPGQFYTQDKIGWHEKPISTAIAVVEDGKLIAIRVCPPSAFAKYYMDV